MEHYTGENYCYSNAEELEHEILLPGEVMNYLACGRSKFYQLVRSGELKAFRVGKQWRVTCAAIRAFTEAK